MGSEVLVSGGNMLRYISLCNMQEMKSMPLEHAGALCTANDDVFCACGDAIWRIDRKTMMPCALFAGGPGMKQLLPSADGSYLYVLCSDADCVMMLHARTGNPILLNHAGVNPRQMVLETGVLVIAGGEHGAVFLLDAQTLVILDCLIMPGPVYSIAVKAGMIYALCLTASLSSELIAVNSGGTRCHCFFPGMPGVLLMRKNSLLVSTEEALYQVTLDGERILNRSSIPGRAAWMQHTGKQLLMLDSYTDRLWCSAQKNWRVLCGCAASAAL